MFNDIISALCAQKSLNGHYLRDVDVKLSVDWCDESFDSSNLMADQKAN